MKRISSICWKGSFIMGTIMRFGGMRVRERERSKTSHSRKRSDHPTLHKLNCPIFPSLSDEIGVAIPSGTTS